MRNALFLIGVTNLFEGKGCKNLMKDQKYLEYLLNIPKTPKKVRFNPNEIHKNMIL
jgi:hypothetical protein